MALDWGALTGKDQQRVKKLFELIDADKDGIISFQEVRTANGGDPDGTMQKMFTKLDRNKDGQASMEEWVKFWVSLHKAKGNRPFTKFLKSLATSAMSNNAPAPSEVSGQPPGLPSEVVGLATELFGMLDLDSNGNVSASEFANAHGGSGDMWTVLDSNKDGQLSLKELLGVLGVMKSKKGVECVQYYVKHMITIIRSNQADNPKARGMRASSGGTRVFEDRRSRIEAIEAEIRRADGALMDAITKKDGSQLNAVSTRAKDIGSQMLMACCWRGDCSSIDELMMLDVSVNTADAGGFSAMMYSVLAAEINTMKSVFKGDTDKKLNICAQDSTGATALMVAACEGNMTAGGALAVWAGDKGKELVNMANQQGNNALHFAAMNGHPAFVAFMLNMGCDILAQNEDGEDALALATKSGHTETSVLLKEEAQRLGK